MGTRDRLLDEAISLFAREGYERVTVNEVVEAANVTKGAFYYYFDSKEDLLAEIHDSYVEFARTRFQAIADTPGPAGATMAALVTELLDQIHSYRSQVVILWESRRSLPASASSLVDGKKADIRRLFQITIERGQADGDFGAHDSKIAAQGIFGMGMWAYHWYQPDGRLSAKEITNVFTHIVLGGLRSTPEKSPLFEGISVITPAADSPAPNSTGRRPQPDPDIA